MKLPKVYIIILNYNNWWDTVECLESVLRNEYSNYQVIVVDNNSPNNSMEYIKAWAEGKLDVWVKPDRPLRHLSFPPVKKPIPYVYYMRNKAEIGGNKSLESKLKEKLPEGITTKYPMIFIQTGKNLGFAGGNNVGIRYAFAKNDFEYIWFLNNDTVIEKNTLHKMVQKFESYKNEGKRVGIVGSKLLYYDNPKIIQAYGGGKIYPLIGLNKNYQSSSCSRLDYITGASFFVSKQFIEKVGLWDEIYFLNHEDIDYSYRGILKKFMISVCDDCVLYHKETATIGKKSFASVFFRTRNTFIFTLKFYKKFLIFVLMFNFLKFVKGILKRDKIYLKAVLRAYIDFLKYLWR